MRSGLDPYPSSQERDTALAGSDHLDPMPDYYVYVLENSSGRLYIGHTSDVSRRLAQHNDPEGHSHLGKYTHRNGPWVLLGQEKGFVSRSEQMIRERQLKAWKSPAKVRGLFE